MSDNVEISGASLYNYLEKRHRITNLVGIPIVFCYFIYAISGGLGTISANYKEIALLTVVSFTLIIIAVIIHERFNHRYLADAMNFLDESERKDDESVSEYYDRARKGIKCLLDFPLVGSRFSLGTWPLTIITILLSVHFLFFRFPISLVLLMMLGSVSGGILVAVFQFNLFKRGIQPFLSIILQKFPQYWKEQEYFEVKLGLRIKMLVSFALLMFVMMTMISVLIFFDVTKMTQAQWAEMQRQKIEDKVEIFAPKLLAASTPEERMDIIGEMDITPEEGHIHMIDGKGLSLLPRISVADEKDIVRTARKEIFLRIAGLKEKVEIGLGKDVTIMTPLPGLENVTLDLEPDDMVVNAWVKVPESDNLIVLRRSFRTFLPVMSRIIVLSIFLVILGLLISVIFTHFASKDVTDPVEELVTEVEKISRGELSQELNVITYDEVGVFAVHMKKMIENLRSMITQIGQAAAQVETATVRIVDGFKQVSEGATTQSSAVDETSAAMDEMNASIKGIGENVETLASTGQQSSASIMQMSATIEEVADNVESLASSIEETTSSISEMAASIRQVAENVENLSRKTEGTVSSVTQMEVSIKEVQSGAEETANLSEQTAGEAESGVNKVQNTIKGISQAREDSELAVRVIHELAQRAEEIGNILTVIDDVTDETNLLALNAAIIAAQAGEYGRGFAVVADEIKDLAERTAQSTQEISQLIEAVQGGAREAVDAVSRGYDAVEEGVKLSEEAGVALNKILDSSRKSTIRTKDIAKATVEQAQRTREVLKFFEEISENIHQVEVATREQSKGTDQIQKTSERMREIAKIVKKATQEQYLGSKQITQAMENINHIVSFINTSQKEQIKNTDQVVFAIQEIKAIASQNDDGVEEMFQASANLSSLAEQLRSMVEAFKLVQSNDSAAS